MRTFILALVTILALTFVGFRILSSESEGHGQRIGDAQSVDPYLIVDETSDSASSDRTQASTGAVTPSPTISPNQTPIPAQLGSTSTGDSKLSPSPVKTNDGFVMLPAAERISHLDFQTNKGVVVVVDKKNTQTYVLQEQNGDLYIVFECDNAIGTSDSPTPPGTYTVASKTTQPTWVPPKSIDPNQKEIGPYKNNKDNPLGVVAIRLDKGNIVLHGTNNPDSIGKKASHGCIRHRNDDIQTIYRTVDEGTKVIVTDSIQGTQIDLSLFAKENSA